jgi:Tfp pilus assembly protein PilX
VILTKRRIASDKIFLLMITLMVLALVGAIALAVMKKYCPTFIKEVLQCTAA